MDSMQGALCRWGIILVFGFGLSSQAQMTTAQYDNARTGANLNETLLTPRNVNQQQFGKLFTLTVDGDIYAQPLFLSGLEIPGKGRHDVLFIATEHDSVYAFDAYGNPSTPLWHTSLLKEGETTVAARDVFCPFTQPEVGITSTPVIDVKSGTLYVLARTKKPDLPESRKYSQHLHALSVLTGQEKLGGPVEIHATAHGSAEDGKNGVLAFEPLRENPRAALLLSNGLVYLSWGSSCDVGPYHGWVLAYDAKTLQQKAVFNASPNADDSGFWASDTGPAADPSGNVFIATGNGKFDLAQGGKDYGDTLLKLRVNSSDLQVADYFTPSNADELEAKDHDLGSGGPMLLPDQAGPHPHLALIGGKGPMLYLIDRDHLGRYQSGNNSHAVQTIPTSHGIYGSTAYWNHHVYVLSDHDALRDFVVHNGRLDFKAASTFKLEDHAATPTISANGSKDGIVWVVSSKGWNSPDRKAVLYAADASDVTHLLYASNQNSARDGAGYALRFNIPTIAHGHVYIGAKGEVDVYGLLPKKP